MVAHCNSVTVSHANNSNRRGGSAHSRLFSLRRFIALCSLCYMSRSHSPLGKIAKLAPSERTVAQRARGSARATLPLQRVQ